MRDDEQQEVQAGPVVKVARDLTEIVKMTAMLDDQAEHKANDSLMPGGLATVALAGVTNLEAWHNRLGSIERAGEDIGPMLEDNEDEWEPPLQTLLFWSEDWRREHDSVWDVRPTVATEANFIRWCLDWAWDREERWDDFAADIRQARVRMENVLYAGKRAERSRVVCNQCIGAARLIVVRGSSDDGTDDLWKCPACKHRFDKEGVSRAHGAMLRSQGAEKWVHQVDAIGTLKAQGRPERTVRAWLADGIGAGYCDPVTHEVWIWWPALWTKHASTPTRKSKAG